MTETSIKLKLLEERKERETASLLELFNQLTNSADNSDAVRAGVKELRAAIQDMRSVYREIFQLLHQETLSQMDRSFASDAQSYAIWQQLEQTTQLALNWVMSEDEGGKRHQQSWLVIASLLQTAATISRQEEQKTP